MILVREQRKAIDLPTLFNWFIIYSCIGWIYETTYCYLTTGRYTKRGFLYGPICPIYGLSVLLMIVLLTDRCKSIFSLFCSCALIATVLEYISSLWMEAVFNKRWWNYSTLPLNINGRVCLGATILFGVAGVLFVRFIHPAIIKFKNRYLSPLFIKRANKIIFTLFLIDVLASVQRNVFRYIL